MRRLSTCWIWAGLYLFASAPAAAPADPVRAADAPRVASTARAQFDIPPQPMNTALEMFGQQADVQFTYATEIASGLTTQGVTGEMSPEAALEALLAGTPLYYTQLKPGVFTIGSRLIDVSAAASRSKRRSTREPAHATARQSRDAENAGWLDVGEGRSPGMVVTGTHIRDTEPLALLPMRLDRSDIEKTGFTTVEDVMRTVPQNFGGGPTDDTFRGLEAETNSARGTALNLRGLGAGATLLLFDGRRLAPGGAEGSFTDVAGIPLLALEYIEILPNGASALYGSEAVGGVVNLVPRRDFGGAESQGRAGAVTTGARDEYQLGQTFGAQWSEGGALLAFEYLDRGALPADDRELARSDLRRFGGDNFDTRSGSPGTILDAGVTYAIPRGQDGRSLTPADLIAGSENLYDLRAGSDLLQDEKRLSALASLHRLFGDRVEVFGDAMYTRRDLFAASPGVRATIQVPGTNPFYVSPSGGGGPILIARSFEPDLGKLTQDAEVDTANLALGTNVGIGDTWQIKAYIAYAMERQAQAGHSLVEFGALAVALADPDPATAFNPFGDGSFTNPATLDSIRASQRLTTDSELRSINATADGPVLEVAGGKAMLAVGIDHRDQSFEASNVTRNASSINALHSVFDRRITSVFSELRVPLFGSGNRRPGLQRLEFSLAGRFEKYSDYGNKAVPAFGLAWSPVAGLAFRGSWSESYKAPNLADLDETNNGSQIFPLVDPQSPGGGPTPMLLWIGKNADLDEETATSWTVGIDLRPRAVPDLSVGFTYFDIEFNDRVQEIASAFPDLSDPRLAEFIDRNPTAAEREEVCSRSTFFGSPADCLAAPIGAILDLRIQNIAVNRTRGLDVLGKYEFANALGEFSLDVTGTWLFEFSQALARSGVAIDLLDTQNNPLDLRVRSSLSWRRLGMGATLAVNYADSYRDVASQPERGVGSWTTYDLQLRYDWDERSDWLNDSTVSLSIHNLFDKDPPFLNNQLGIGYDQENADLGGRFVRLHLRKRW